MLRHANDPDLLGLETKPLGGWAAARKAWRKAQERAKATIVLNLALDVCVPVRSYIDADNSDDKNARQLRDRLKSAYTITNVQAIQNQRKNLDALKYTEGKS